FGYWEPVIRAAKEYWLSALQEEVWLTPTRNQLHRVSHDLCPPGPISPGGNQRLRLAKLSARTSSVERAKRGLTNSSVLLATLSNRFYRLLTPDAFVAVAQ